MDKKRKIILVLLLVLFSILPIYSFFEDLIRSKDYSWARLDKCDLAIPKEYDYSENVYLSGTAYVSDNPPVRIFAFDLDNMTEAEMMENDYIDYSKKEQLYSSDDYEQVENALENLSDVYGNLDLLLDEKKYSYQRYIYWGYNNGFWLVFFYNSSDEHIIYAINDSSRKTAFDRDVGGYILTHTD